MNTPSPVSPLSPLSQQARGKSNVRLAVISIIALHAVFFGGLLLQGCKPKTIDQNLAGGEPGALVPAGDVTPPVATNVALFGPETTQPALTGDAYSQPGVALTPSVPTNETWVASPPPVPPVEPVQPILPPSTTEYVIKARDTLGQIAKNHGVSLDALLQANPGIEPLRLKIGDRVQVPAPSARRDGATPVEDPGAEKMTTHVVKGGDNLTRIAKTYGITIKELRAANNLKTDRILIGQKLKIPAVAPAGQTGAVETGFPPR